MPSRERAATNREPAPERTASVARRPEGDGALTSLQHALGNQAVTQMLGAPAIQPKLQVGAPGDRFEQEAESIAEAIVSPPAEAPAVQHATAGEGVQRLCADCEEEETLRRAPVEGETATAETVSAPPETEQATTAETAQTASEPAATSAPAVLVDDEAETVQPGQMRKSEFLAALRDSVCAAANEGLASAGQSTADCPWVEYWFEYAGGKDAGYVERAIRKYAPEGAAATSAEALIPIVTARVRASVDTWARTGEISGVPEGFGDGGALGATSGVFFKARPGGPGRVSNPEAIRHQLGGGRPLPAGVRSRMESAFGSSFSGVRIHTDPGAAGLSDSLNARAFTVGQHVAFGAGEYRPGSLVGDALLAHELAHVVQQGGATTAAAPMGKEAGQDTALEEDADRAAVSAVAAGVTAGAPGLKDAARGAFPRLRSGLGLSRCSKSGQATKTLTVNVTYLSGGSTDLATHLAKANLVYKQANVDVVAGTQKTLDETQSKAVLGADLVLDEYSDPSSPTAEEQALLKENRGATVTMYYVKGMSRGSLGEAFWPSLGQPSSFVYASSNSRTWPHELGHVLLDDGAHPSDADNFMAQTSVASGKELMTRAQIDTIRKNVP